MIKFKNILRLFFLVLIVLPVFSGCGSGNKTLRSNSAGLAWPMYGKNAAHTNAGKEVLSFPMVKMWETRLDAGIGKSLAVAEGLIYAGTMNGRVHILDLNSGKKLETIKIKDAVLGGPLYWQGNVYTVKQKGDETLYCYKSGTKKEKWKVDAGSIESSPVFFGGKIFLTNYEGELLCLDAVSGKMIWRRKFDNPLLCSPAVTEGYIVAGDSKGIFRCFTEKEGKTIWEAVSGGQFWGSPVITGNMVFWGDRSGNINAASLSEGTIIWRYVIKGAFYNSPAVNGEIAAFGANDDHLYVFDAKTGALKWKYDAGSPVSVPPVITAGHIIFGTLDQKMIAVDKVTGKMVWEFMTAGRVRTAPVVFDDILICASENKNIYAFKSVKPNEK